MKTKWIVFLCVILLLSACGSGSSNKDQNVVVTEPIVAGDYKILSSFASSDTRQTHVEFNRGWYDREAIGKGLMHYSKQHFSPDTYYLMEGQVFSRNDLLVGVEDGDLEGLLGRKSSDNPYGLNPELGSFINGDISVGPTTTPIVDIFEINFTKEASNDPEVDGISLAIVVTPNIVDADKNDKTLSDDVLMKAGEQAAVTIVEYLRKKPEIGNKTPIYITLFKASSTDDTLPGVFFGESFAKDSVAITKINEQWAIFPSDTATALDGAVAQQFDALKSQMHMIIPNDIGIIGKGKFVDNKLDSLQITVTSQAKTYTESSAIIQSVNELLGNFESDEFEISVRFINENDAYAMIKREKGSKKTTVIIY